MIFQRAGSPFETTCWRAIRSARSIASEPPLANTQRVIPGGSQRVRRRSTSRTRSSVAKGGTTKLVAASVRAATSATSARPWPMLATTAPPAASRMRRPSDSTRNEPSVRATGSPAPRPGRKGYRRARSGSTLPFCAGPADTASVTSRTSLPLRVVAVLACGAAQSPEDEVRAALAALEQAAEAGDAGAFAELVSAAYQDPYGHDREKLRAFVAFHVMRSGRGREVVVRVREV